MIEKFNIAGYCRISVDEELDRDNTSIENQKAILSDFVKRRFPDSTLTFYEDRDRSGYTFEQREGYQAMRRELMGHAKDILIVKDFSRFSRRNSRGLVELEDLRDAGVRIISIGDNIDFPNDDDWLKIQFQFLINEMPVTDTSKKVKSVIKRRQQDGKWICAAPYGYIVDKHQQFEVVPTEAEIVRRIFQLYIDGWGYKKIANQLTDEGIPTPRMAERDRKEAAELIQGTWINEVGELTAMSKQETNAVKQFLSKTHDIYRAAYGKRTDKYPRRCVFFGTSNEEEFLKDVTGNRRFWPVDVGVCPAKKSVWRDLPREVGQIWAEAYLYWMLGEPLYLPKELEQVAEVMQESHRELSGKEGIVQEFLERDIPSNWDSLSLMSRRQFNSGNMKLPEGETLVKREKVCAMEIWVECLNGEAKYMGRKDSMEINSILASAPGWRRNKSKRRYGPHGIQRGFERVHSVVDSRGLGGTK